MEDNRLAERSKQLQDDMHEVIDQSYDLTKDKKISYNHYVTAFLLSKIAQLELKIEELSK